MRAGFCSVAVAIFALLACAGCGSQAAAPSPTVPVKGKVTWKGKPLTRGTVMFEPQDYGRDAYGNIQPDGTFVLSTFKAGDGAVPGTHRVGITATGTGGADILPLKYRSPSSSKIEFEVAEGKAEYVIEIK
jgi:hypothetical protein